MRGTSMGPSARSKPTILKRLRTRFGIPVALIALLALVVPAGASADALGANTEFAAPSESTIPTTLVKGSDGNMWFTDPGFPAGTNANIGSVTPGGTVTLYTPALSGYAWGIASGPDGNIWFTEPGADKVGYIKPSEPTTSLQQFEVAGMSTATFKPTITAGPDGNLWVPLGTNGLAKITTAGVVTPIPTSTEGFKEGADICSVTAGPDGNVWFGDCGTTKGVGKITPTGTITEFSVAGGEGLNIPYSLVAGSDGRLWFPANNAPDEHLGAITTAGVPSYYKTPTTPEVTTLSSLTAGPDGNVWATETTSRNEIQEASIKGEGTFKLGFKGQETGATFTGDLTSGSKLVKNVVTTSGAISKNELVSSTAVGFPAGVIRVAAIKSATEIEISTAATATTAGASFSADLAATPAASACGLNTTCNTTTIREALDKLSTIGGSNANVTVSGSGSVPSITRTITFKGKFEREDVELMTCDGSKLTGAGAGCTVKTISEPIQSRLFRIKPANPNGMKAFTLKPATLLQSTTKANALAAGPGGNLWYTSIGTPKAIGKFGTEASEFTLNVSKEGSTGDGTVVSNPAGIECGSECSADFTAGTVVLKASPDSESLFVSWKGCDVGGANGRECKVTGTANQIKNVTAKFTTAYDVSVSRKGTGLGKVGSSPGGVLCLSNCSSTSAKFKELTNVTLTATPSKHFTFSGWSGDCTGTGTCVLSALSADKSVEAEFAEVAKFDLTVTKSGGGQGTVKAKQAGINCGATCSTMAAKYYEGEVIELLVPTPSKGSTFGGWSGAGCSGTGTCLVTMSGAKSVNAEFK